MSKNTVNVYAIIREDDWVQKARDRIYVKEIVSSLEEAEQEVKRLNALNCGKGCFYYFQTTRMNRNILT